MPRRRSMNAALLLFLGTVVLSNTMFAADWTVSPFRAQVAGLPSTQESDPTDESATPSQKKNIGRGALFSLVIPGTGQLYGGQWWRAIPWFVIEVGAWAAFSHFHGAGLDKTDEFEAYADGNFIYNTYMWREYNVALSGVSGDTLRSEVTFDQWKASNWDFRSTYLPPPFTHDINTADRQQFYEMIGKYLKQFGFGWKDAYDSTQSGYIWLDDPATVEFDETTPSLLFFSYRDLRGEANDLLDKGNVAIEVVLVNHVLSALDAALTVRSYNKRIASSPLGNLKLRYDARKYDGQVARYLTVSIPLD